MIKANYTDQNFIERLLPNLKKIKLKMRGETLSVECNLQSYVAPGYESENFNVILDKSTTVKLPLDLSGQD